MTALSKKIDFALIIDVNKANPNGDPLDGNRPRVDFAGRGEISDVCLKRKLRNRALAMGLPVFVVSSGTENDGCQSLRERFDSYLENGGNPERDSLCQQWFDVRAFGQVFAYKAKTGGKGKGRKKKDEAESAEDSSGDSVSLHVRGPVTIQTATSLKPVIITSMQITKSVNSEPVSGGGKSSDTMGQKHRVEQGTYVAYGAVSPQLAEETGFTEEDAALLKKLLLTIFEGDASSARPEGPVSVRYLVWWEQENTGGISSGRVHRSLRSVLEGQDAEAALSDAGELRSRMEKILPGLKPEILEGL